MSKKIAVILILCVTILAHWPAQAWFVPDEVYSSTADLPEAVRAAIPEHLVLLDGTRVEDTICLLFEAEHDIRFGYVFERTDGGYRLACTSAPLPMIGDSKPWISCGGYELSVYYDNAYFLFHRSDDRKTWNLACIQYEDVVSITNDWVSGATGENESFKQFYLHGSYLFERDLSKADIAALPRTLAGAFALVDTNGYAMVKSDKPTDRLHLRTAPSTGAASIGRYYSGTPVQILEDRGEWAKVSVCGVQGYMMTAFLAFGQDMLHVEQWFPSRMGKNLIPEEAEQGVNVYARPDTKSAIVGVLRESNAWPQHILATVGDNWYHILSDDGLSGFVETRYFWDGNG